MNADHATRQRLRREAYGDWVGVVYRGLLYTLAMTPVWAMPVMLVIVCHRAHL